MSHIGVAREVAAATGRRVVAPVTKPAEESDPAAGRHASVENQAGDLCPMYTARVIRGVRIGPSPEWLARRLTAIGLRPINNVVDVTNYVLHEVGQPLHAFDLGKLVERRIVVRRARSGESFTAIDGSKHRLREGMLVIADGRSPVAVAGVMGGAESQVTDATTDIVLESARFEPLSVRSTSRALRLASDSSYRFERGVDPRGVEAASARAAQLIVELAGGEVARGVVAVGEAPEPHRIVAMRPSRCNQLLGIEIPAAEMGEYLAALGLEPVVEQGRITCTIPSFRLDLAREADLIEEVARLHGLDRLPIETRMHIVARPPQAMVLARRAVGDVLVAHGYHEAITYTFCSPESAAGFERGWSLIRVDEEKKKAEPSLRPSLLPSLLACRKQNQDAGNQDVRLFEIARVFGSDGGEYRERTHLAFVFDSADRERGVRAVRGMIEELVERMGVAGVARIEPGSEGSAPWALPAARLLDAAGRVVGEYGPASGQTLKRFDLQTAVVLGWVDYSWLIAAYPPSPAGGELPRFPAIERDLSIIVGESARWQGVEGVIRGVGAGHLEDVTFVGAFRGKPIERGRKSLTLRLTFRDAERTLRHEEVSGEVDRIVSALRGELAAELRE